MAARYMKVKRVVIPFLTLLIMCSQLAGCALLTPTETVEELNAAQDVVIEYSEVNYSKEIEPTKIMSVEELHKIFEEVYSNRKSDKIDASEISAIESKANKMNKLLPGDYVDQYVAWRPVTDHSLLDQYFEFKSETKTLKSDVNVYDDFSEDAIFLGKLTKDTEINILGTGIPGTDAEGWLIISIDNDWVFIKRESLAEESIEVQETVKVDEPVKVQETVKAEEPVKQEPVKAQEPAKQEPVKQEPVKQEPNSTGTFYGNVPDRVFEDEGGLVQIDPNIDQGPQLDPNDYPDWISIG